MKQYTKITLGADSRTELHDKLGLTGAEVSINTLPAGAGVPFVHAHKQNLRHPVRQGQGSDRRGGDSSDCRGLAPGGTGGKAPVLRSS